MIKYTTIKYGGCCGKPEREYLVPDNISPHELTLLIPGLSLEDAIDLLSRRTEPDPSCNSFSSQLIQRQVRKECLPPAQGSLVTITIPAGRFVSNLSQLDADRQAEEEFRRIAQPTANQLGTCSTPDCVGCSSFRVVRTIACGEFRRNTKCVNGQCVDISQEYFVCTGECEGSNCKQPCSVCSANCPTGSCPPGSNCVNGVCVINCEGADCSRDCPEGRCQDPCTICNSGRCQPKSCPSGKICVNGQCIDRPCNPECSERVIPPGPNDCIQRSIVQSCQSGNCVDTTQERTVNIREGLSCGNNRTCRNGVCTENPCINQGGSCTSGVCCAGTFCFNGICVSSCPQGYIQQAGTCVIDNGPNVVINQTVSSVNNPFCFFGTHLISYGCSSTGISVLPPGVNSILLSNGQSIPRPKTLYVSTFQPYVGLSDRQCDSNGCLYVVPAMNRFWLSNAIKWHIDNNVNPNLLGYYTVLYPDQQTTCVQGTNAPPDVCTGTAAGNPTFFFVFSKTSPSSPNITNLPNAGGSIITTVTATGTISSQNPYGISGYSPTPNNWSAFGFTGSWQTFTLQSNLLNSNTIQGRIVGSNLEFRLPGGVPVFGSGNLTNQRLIGTFTVGTTVTKTLQ